MPNSKIDVEKEFNQEVWVVSVLNTGSKLGGHTVIVVEGIKASGELFIGQYDVTATAFDEDQQNSSINTKGYINKVRTYEGCDYTRDYSQYSATSHYAYPEKVNNMITSIKEDVETCKEATKGKGEPILYQYVGTNHSLSEKGKGHNCASWCIEKLAIAGIGDGSTKSKPKIAASGGCAIL